MWPGKTRRARFVYAGQLLALSVVYVALGKPGLSIAPASGFATVVWAPTGISLAALVIGGDRLWPAIAAGAFATNLWRGAPPLVACGIAAGNTLEALVGARILRSIPRFRGSLDRFAEIGGLILAAAVSPLVSATAGMASLAWGGVLSAGEQGRLWRVWWTGDLMADLIVVPLLLTWACGGRVDTRRAVAAEAVLLAAALVACTTLLFAQPPEAVEELSILQPYVLLLPLIWAALRFGARGAASGTFVVAAVAVWGTFTGHGAFVRPDRTDSLVRLHVFLSTVALASLALGAAVSEREASQRDLRDRERLFRAVVEGTSDMIFVKDRIGRYVMVNAACARLTGKPAEAAGGTDDATWLPAAESLRIREMDTEVMRSGEPRTFEEVLTVAGEPRVFNTTKAPYRDDAGRVIGIFGIARDVTERRRVEQRWRESEERQRLAVEAAGMCTWCWNLKEGGLSWTPPCRRMHGLGPDEEPTLARFLATLHAEDRERTARAVARSIAERTDYRIEHRAVWPDGTVRWLSVLGRPVPGDAGEPERMVGVTLDVTAQKEAEAERADLLARERAARAEAQAATQAKDAFLAVLSHELRTPLQAMLGWTQLLRERPLDERMVRKGLDTLERNVRMQAQLIEDLLDVSRIAAGKLRLERARVDLAEVVAAAVDSAKMAATARSIQLEATSEPLDGRVLGDRVRLQQVVSNLLVNAVKFTPDGGRIRVRLEREGTSARIVVEDSGCGISAEFLPHVFDRFRQAENGTTRRHGGLGLGLAIVRHLVEKHEGTVRVESPGEGQGATFTVTLPLVTEGPPAVTTERGAPPLDGPGDRVSLAGIRVLVVDDDPDARELLHMVLSADGAEVHAVGSVHAALDALASHAPHLLVSDIGMPEEDGYDLIRRLRARESVVGGHVPAVALSAFAGVADREQALALGFEEHLAKPASPADLTRTVARLLGRTT